MFLPRLRSISPHRPFWLFYSISQVNWPLPTFRMRPGVFVKYGYFGLPAQTAIVGKFKEMSCQVATPMIFSIHSQRLALPSYALERPMKAWQGCAAGARTIIAPAALVSWRRPAAQREL